MANYKDIIPALTNAGFSNTQIASIVTKHWFKAMDDDEDTNITRFYNELTARDFEFDVTLECETYLLGSDVVVRFDGLYEGLSFRIEKPVDFQRKAIRQ